MKALDSTVPMTRAERYPHGDGINPMHGDGIQRLDTDRLSVLFNCQEVGMVTLAAHGPDPLDAYGYEFDLTPEAARILVRLLSEAAGDAAGPEVSE